MDLSPEMMNMLVSYGPIVVMIVIFYFMLYRPQKKEQSRRKEMLDSLKKGNKVIFAKKYSLNKFFYKAQTKIINFNNN